jgi:hypothetical protein
MRQCMSGIGLVSCAARNGAVRIAAPIAAAMNTAWMMDFLPKRETMVSCDSFQGSTEL